MDRLVPDSEHTITVTLYELHSGGSWLTWGKASDSFHTKDGCYQEQPGYNPDNDDALKPAENDRFEEAWYGGSGAHRTTETEIVQWVSAKSPHAPLNSGRCVYYTYSPGGNTPVRSAYIHNNIQSRRAYLELSNLRPGTAYTFTISYHSRVGGSNAGATTWTQGIPLSVASVTVAEITESTAKATVEIVNEVGDEQTVYLRYYKTADEDEPNRPETEADNKTNTAPLTFALSGLAPGTEYKVEASLKDDFLPFRTESEIFVTKPNKPTVLTVTPGDRKLEVSWTKPDGGDAIDSYIVQWKSGIETFEDAATDGREVTVAHVSGTTTYDTTISGLANGTEYTLHVIAVNESGEAVSEEKKGTPATIPDEPISLEVTPGNEKLTLTWVAPIETGGASITGFVVEYKQNTALTWTTHTPIGSSTLTAIITGLTNDILYDVRVRADNGVVADPYNWAVKTGTPVPDPSIGEVSVPSNTITKTTATATVTIDDAKTGDEQAVHFRHRVNTSGTS